MWLTTASLLSTPSEPDCFARTAERKYYHSNGSFIKRSLRRDEWMITKSGTIHVPRLGPERLINEAAAMQFVAEHTTIPVPKLYCCFQDDGAVYLVMEYVEGVLMADLSEAQKLPVKEQVRTMLSQLRSLRSTRVGAPDPRPGLLIPPYRLHKHLLHDNWKFPEASGDAYVFCHNDLSQHNIIVDPTTLRIRAVIDWEYAGFWPEAFEAPFFERLGPSAALSDEKDDADELLEFFNGSHAALQA